MPTPTFTNSNFDKAIDPSVVELANFTKSAIEVNGKLIGNSGTVIDAGNELQYELWDDETEAVLKTRLQRRFYNNYQCTTNDIDSGIEEVLSNGGGTINITGPVIKPNRLTGRNGIHFKFAPGLTDFTNQSTETATTFYFSECNNSVIVENLIIDNTKFDIIRNSTPAFINCKFTGVKFNINESSTPIFKDCTFINCSFVIKGFNSGYEFARCTFYDAYFDSYCTNTTANFYQCQFYNIRLYGNGSSNDTEVYNFYACKIWCLRNPIEGSDIPTGTANEYKRNFIALAKEVNFTNCAFSIISYNFNFRQCDTITFKKCYCYSGSNNKLFFNQETNKSSNLIQIEDSFLLNANIFTGVSTGNKLLLKNSLFLNAKFNLSNTSNYDLNWSISTAVNCTFCNAYNHTNSYIDCLKTIINTTVFIGTNSDTRPMYPLYGRDQVDIINTYENISSINDYSTGSYIKFVVANTVATGYEMFTEFPVDSPLAIFNGVPSFLKYHLEYEEGEELQVLEGISNGAALELYRASNLAPYLSASDIPAYDIFGNYRAELPRSGVSEVDSTTKNVNDIHFDLSGSANGLSFIDLLLSQYSTPVVVPETSGNNPKFSWRCYENETDFIELPAAIDPGSTDAFSSKCLFSNSLTNHNKVIKCICEYGDEVLSLDIKLKVAQSPKLTFPKPEFTAWTNYPSSITCNIETDYDNIEAGWLKTTEAADGTLNPTSVPEFESFIYRDNEILKSTISITAAGLDDAGLYKCKITVQPDDFITKRIFESDYTRLAVNRNVVIDKDATTNGNITLEVGDKLNLNGSIIQGDNAYFVWQQTNDTTDINSWIDVTEPRQDLFTTVIDLLAKNLAGTYYRLYAFTKNQDGSIATEDYSNLAIVKVYPKALTGNEMSSDIVMFKLPIDSLTENATEVSIDDNYKRYSSISLIEPSSYKKNVGYPILHRRKDNDLWQYIGDLKYGKTYVPGAYPSDVDIDKYNTKFGVAAERYIPEKNYGGNIFLLELDRLNDNKVSRINVPALSVNCLDAYNTSNKEHDNVYWQSIGEQVFVRNGYIAVSDSLAKVDYPNGISNFTTYSNPKLNGNIWEFTVSEPFTDEPYYNLYRSEDNTLVPAELTYNNQHVKVTILSEFIDSRVPAGKYKLCLGGDKPSATNRSVISVAYNNSEDLIPDSNNLIRYSINYDETVFKSVPVANFKSARGQLLAQKLNEDFNRIEFIIQSDEVIRVDEIEVILTGTRKNFSNPCTVNKIYSNNHLRPDENGIITWEIVYDNTFNGIPLINIYDSSEYDNERLYIRSIQFTERSVIIKFTNREMLHTNEVKVCLFGESSSAEVYEVIRRNNVGRVLLFKYDMANEIIKLVRVIAPPSDIAEVSFGQSVEFDDHNNILISAPGQVVDNYIGYSEIDYQAYPSYNSTKQLKFGTRGQVYVYNLDELLDCNFIDEAAIPKQVLSNQHLFRSVDYQYGNWGKLSNLYRSQALYTIKDSKTNGKRIYEAYGAYNHYLDQYEFNCIYDFSYRGLFPEPYTEDDFKTRNSKTNKISIGYRVLYYTRSVDEFYGTAISYNNGQLVIGAPYYQNGFIELWSYDTLRDCYTFNASIDCPDNGATGLFGLNVEACDKFCLVTYRAQPDKQSVAVLDCHDNKLTNRNLTLGKSKYFGNALDSFGNTFIISDGNKLIRYLYKTDIVDVIQTVNMRLYSIFDTNGIVITKDKILVPQPAYTSASKYTLEVDDNLHYQTDTKLKYISSQAGAVLQLTLNGGSYQL